MVKSNSFKVSVIVPNYNGKNLLEKNLPHLLKAKDDKSNNIIEIIVVDDCSKDESVKFLKKNYPQIRLIKHTKNRGFASSINTGVRMAKGDLVALINSDVAPSENFLVPVFKHFAKPKVFGVSLHEKGYSWAKGSFSAGYIQLAMGPETKQSHKSFYVSGGSGVFRRSIWKKLGGMDEKLLSPFYWEDLDICYRAEKRGYLNLWEPGGMVVHDHASTIGKLPKKYVSRIKERNQLLLIWKNITSKSLIRNHITNVIKRCIRHPGYLRVVLMALGKLHTAIKGRKKEIKESKVSDEAVFMKYR